MFEWDERQQKSGGRYANLIIFGGSFAAAILAFFVFYPYIESINNESTLLISIMFIPAIGLGFTHTVWKCSDCRFNRPTLHNFRDCRTLQIHIFRNGFKHLCKF